MGQLSQVVLDGIVLGGFYALVAQGLSLVFGVMGVLNLAHGECVLIGAYLAWTAQHYLGVDPLIALPVIMALGFGFGWVLCRTLVIRVVERPPLMSLLLTFGIGAVAQGVLLKLFSSTPRVTTTGYSADVVSIFGLTIPTPRAFMLLGAVVILVLTWALLNRTRVGRSIQAAAQNKAAARVVGIDIAAVYAIAFGIGIALVFAGGTLLGSAQGFYPFLGPLLTMKAFAIVVLGGVGRMTGTVLAAMVVGLIETLLASYVPSVGTGLGIAAAFILVVVVLVVRPNGISGGKQVTAGV
ncbi:branched-chain amino acid ABC transporter permease [Prauserella cavernicola]|uniref:Branched-chain amino acid ABC transporter permease n=1 Tax=Prauserella cavernicola TaxID=2800127 RepID=A0A934QNL9_9PSEU|nr:branched-chain amino acid ABC transporter permease [Prauserella cavernicola]MBK1783211.1 branched-chain amino acid ABC transporter permease [Prauserella cavernicola]